MLQRNGRGFGFRGSSPPWPYVGRGRGGQPRCQYPGLTSGAGYGAGYGRGYGAGGYVAAATGGEDVASLKAQAAAMQQQLGEIERRIQELEKQD